MDEPCLILSDEQVDELFVALGDACPMEARARDGQESYTRLFRRVVTSSGIGFHQWHPQRLAGRVQTVILRADLTLEVWKNNPTCRHEDFETACALEPVRERLAELARTWGLQEPLPPRVESSGPRMRPSPLASGRAAA